MYVFVSYRLFLLTDSLRHMVIPDKVPGSVLIRNSGASRCSSASCHHHLLLPSKLTARLARHPGAGMLALEGICCKHCSEAAGGAAQARQLLVQPACTQWELVSSTSCQHHKGSRWQLLPARMLAHSGILEGNLEQQCDRVSCWVADDCWPQHSRHHDGGGCWSRLSALCSAKRDQMCLLGLFLLLQLFS